MASFSCVKDTGKGVSGPKRVSGPKNGPKKGLVWRKRGSVDLKIGQKEPLGLKDSMDLKKGEKGQWT